jgi:hypothetical protein
MTLPGKLGSGLGSAGTVVLGALTHSVPLLICVAAGLCLACLAFLRWLLSDDRRVERLNVLLRGGTLSSAQNAEPTRAEIDPQSTFIAQLRTHGKSDLADEVQRALQTTDEPRGEPGPVRQRRHT